MIDLHELPDEFAMKKRSNSKPAASPCRSDEPGSSPPAPMQASIDLTAGAGQQQAEQQQGGEEQQQPQQQGPGAEPSGEPHAPGAALQGPGSQAGHAGGKKKVLTAERLRRMKEEHDRRGVVYVSRIPPHMKPMKLKQLLSQHGATLRVYCAPEDPRTRKLRKRKGGNTGKNFTEGWVEFADKRVAKRVAAALNTQRIGGKKRSAYHDDLWCIKYLPRFKWDDLTEEIAYQRAVHEQRVAAEVAGARRERDHYLHQVDKAKAMRAIAERRAAKQGQGAGAAQAQPAAEKPRSGGDSGGGAGLAGVSDGQGAAGGSAGGDGHSEAGAGGREGRPRVARSFMQRPVKADPTTDAAAPQLSHDVLMMLGKQKKRRLE